MKNLAVILAPKGPRYEFSSKGRTLEAQILQYLAQGPEWTETWIYGAGLDLPGIPVHPGVESREAFFRWLAGRCGAFDQVVVFWGDYPWLDASLTQEMWKNFQDWRAEYLFADGYPLGLAPEILKARIIPYLADLAVKHPGPLDRTFIFDTASKDIVAFDIETQISPIDLRYLRLTLSCSEVGSAKICQGFEALPGGNLLEKLQALEAQQEFLRTVPYSLNIQVTAKPQVNTYGPGALLPRFSGDQKLSVEMFAGVLRELQQLNPQAVVTLGLYHEVSPHSQVLELFKTAAQLGTSLVVETSGLGWNPGILEAAAQIPGLNLRWIVELDAQDPQLYQEIRGAGQAEALSTIETLEKCFPGQVWVQATRLKEYEASYEGFWRYWKEKLPGRVIIQKYNHFSRRLPERRVSDLSPLRRRACWHLKRDLALWLDGRVGLCFQDLERRHELGRYPEQSLAVIWAQGQEFYQGHLKDFSPDLCRGCDEYYTFHF